MRHNLLIEFVIVVFGSLPTPDSATRKGTIQQGGGDATT